MRVAAVQFKATKGDKPESLARLVALARQGAQGSDLLVLPEMAATGYVFGSRTEIEPLVEIARGETFDALSAVACEHACWVVSGFPERDGDRFFNSAHVIDPAGELHACYRKTLLYEADNTWAAPGDSGYLRVETPNGAFTVGICMDLNDDRFVEWCRASRTDAIAFPTNWLDQGFDVWPYWAWRLDGIQSVLVAANTYGAEGGTKFIGNSAIVSGARVLAAAPRTGDGVIRATIG